MISVPRDDAQPLAEAGLLRRDHDGELAFQV